MNILELCLSPSLGGLELYLYRTVRVLSRTDSVLTLISDTGRLKICFEQNGLPFHAVKKPFFRRFPITAAKKLSALIDGRNIDVVHLHWGKDLPLAALAKYFSQKKPRLIYTRHMKMTRYKRDFYHRFLYRQMDLMLTITDQLATEAKMYLSRENTEKIKRLYIGVDQPSKVLNDKERQALRQSWGIADDVFLVGLFGRIEEQKGQHHLIEALYQARKNNTPIKGLIVGGTMKKAYLQGLKKMVAQQKLTQNVIFRDFVDHPQDWMQACDCVALTTREETFGLVLIEAMQAGVAVIGSDSGGVPEIIEDGKTGLRFHPGDSEQLYHALLRLKENRDLKKRLADAGKAKAKRIFSTEEHYQALRKHMSG